MQTTETPNGVEYLKSILDSAFVDCEIEGTALIVHLKFTALIQSVGWGVQFCAVFPLKPMAKAEDAREAANRINCEQLVPRVYVRQANRLALVMDYVVPFEERMPPRLFVGQLRWFEEMVLGTYDGVSQLVA